jgi:hypothetical protein
VSLRDSFEFLHKMKVDGPALLEALEGWCDKQVGASLTVPRVAVGKVWHGMMVEVTHSALTCAQYQAEATLGAVLH